MGEKRKKSLSFVLAKKLKTTSFVLFHFTLSIHLVIQQIKAMEIQRASKPDQRGLSSSIRLEVMCPRTQVGLEFHS